MPLNVECDRSRCIHGLECQFTHYENLRSEALTQNPIADLEKSILDLGLYNLFVVVG